MYILMHNFWDSIAAKQCKEMHSLMQTIIFPFKISDNYALVGGAPEAYSTPFVC